jgi:hypothetical protein
LDDVDGFLDATTACDNVLRDDEPLVRLDSEAAPEYQPARVLLDENMPRAECPSHFLAHHDAAEGGGNDRVASEMTELIREPTADVRGNIGVLEEQRALKELPAVQAGSQNEMAIQ